MRLLWFTVVLIALGVSAVIYTRRPSVFDLSDARVTVQNGGTAGTITFNVVDASQQSVVGLSVATQSYSGWTQDSQTDSKGLATIQPSESEVTAVRFGERTLDLEAQSYYLPHCDDGLLVNVQLHTR